jgi:hypothetical protein
MKGLILFFVLILSLTGNSSAFFGKTFGNLLSKNQCPIKLYNPKDLSFTGHKIYANAETFYPLLETLSTYAKECGVKMNIKQSFIHENPTMSRRMLRNYGAMAFRRGEAIEFELVDQDNRMLCNQLCMKKSLSRLSDLPDAKCFLRKVARNSDFQQDTHQPSILMKRKNTNESRMMLRNKQNELQNKCKKLKMN